MYSSSRVVADDFCVVFSFSRVQPVFSRLQKLHPLSAMNREVASSEKLSSGETAYGETKYLWMNVKVLSIIVGCTFIVVRIPLFFFVFFFSQIVMMKRRKRVS